MKRKARDRIATQATNFRDRPSDRWRDRLLDALKCHVGERIDENGNRHPIVDAQLRIDIDRLLRSYIQPDRPVSRNRHLENSLEEGVGVRSWIPPLPREPTGLSAPPGGLFEPTTYCVGRVFTYKSR